MESESGAKIAIRGKGSVKEGKGRSDAAAMSNLEEDLHCLVTADSEEKVRPPPFEPLLIFSRLLRRLLRLRGSLRQLLQLQKLRTNSRRINFVCLQLLTEHSVMMKDKLVKTVYYPNYYGINLFRR